MLRMFRAHFAALLLALAAGCNHSAEDPVQLNEAPPAIEGEADGPHGGMLVELGGEQYHAELAHDDASHAVTIYLLDAQAKHAPPAGELPAGVEINLLQKGEAHEFKLSAAEPGRYEVVSESLVEALHDASRGKALLSATIAGKQFTGVLPTEGEEGHHHHHNHDYGHDHKHQHK